jgi:phage gp29-like protein
LIKGLSRRWRKASQAGKLRTVAFFCCIKSMSMRDWIIFAEKFGIPLVVGHYDETTGEETRKKLYEALRLLGTEGLAVLAEGARIEIKDRTALGGNGDALHPGLVALCNAEISKVMVGGTLTAETGGPGSFALGKVHKEGAETVAQARARRVARRIRGGLGGELMRRNGWSGIGSPPELKIHVQRSLLQKAQTLKTLVESGVQVSNAYAQEEFEVRAPADEADTLKPPTNAAAKAPADESQAA